MSRLTAKNNMANFNKLNERGYTLNINNTKNVSKYEEALGTTSLQEALSILVNKESTDDEKAGAINDLILIRLILSGKIQFRSSKFAGLIKNTVGKGFEGIRYRDINGIYKEADKLVNDLDDRPGEEPKIFKGFLTTLITTFVTTAGISIVFHALGTLRVVMGNSYNVRDVINDIKSEMLRMGQEPAQHAIDPDGNPFTYYSTQTEEYHQLEERLREEESRLSQMRTSNYFGMIFGKQLLNQGTIFAPLIIGLLSSMYAAHSMTTSQNATIRTALVKMIDRYMIIDEEIFRILNEKGTVPKVFENDGPAMALYNRYIRSMRNAYDKIKKDKNEKNAANKRAEIEKNAANKRAEIETNTGTNLLNMSKFLTPGLEDDCSICTKPLRTAGMPVVELVPCDHKFHESCIKTWLKTGTDKKCPICRREIESLVPVTLITPPLPNNNSSNNNNSGPPLPGSTSGGGTRKKRSNKRKKTKTRSAR